MFTAIFTYELAHWFKKPDLYFFAGAFFLLPLLLFLGTAGYFDPVPQDEGPMPALINAPFQVHSHLLYIGKFMLFLVAAIAGGTIYRDFGHGVYKLIYSFPIPKGVYLGAKFASALTIIMLISMLPALAMITGEFLVGRQSAYIGPFEISGYAHSYAYIHVPNLLFTGLMVFGAVALSRNLYAGFMLVLILIALQFAVANFFHGSRFLTALLDPFGQYASLQQSEYWTLAEKNSRSLMPTPALWYNRAFWMLMAIGTGLFTYFRFSLSYFGIELLRKRPGIPVTRQSRIASSDVGFVMMVSGYRQWLLQVRTLVSEQVRYITRQWIFLLFCLAALLTLVFMLHRVLNTEEVVMLPLTRLILHLPAFFYNNMIVLATFLFAGVLVLRARDSGMEPLIHSTPVPSWVLVASHALSLIVVQNLLLLLLMGAGITIQVLHGYYDIDLPHYLTSLFVYRSPVLAIWAFLACAVFGLSRHFYVGLLLLVLIWLAQFGYDTLGIDTNLLRFNTYPLLSHSDINGHGHATKGRQVLQAYWFVWGLLILVFAAAFWPRMQIFSFRARWASAGRQFSFGMKIIAGALLSLLCLFAYVIDAAEGETIRFREDREVIDEFSSQYGTLKQLAQPRIASVSMDLDFFPERNAFEAAGEYVLINKTRKPIDTLLVRTGIDEITRYEIGRSNKRMAVFEALNFAVHRMDRPLLPGDSLLLRFTIRNRPNSLFQRNSGVLDNGTFLTQDILPRIGYFLHADRPHPQVGSLPDHHYQAWDSDLLRFTATLSTSMDQIAPANGQLVAQWQEGGRNFFTYRSMRPIKFNFSFNSGVYEIHRAHWEDLPVSVYHHPAHIHNLEAVVHGVKAALAFNHRLFGHAPVEEIRIIEYPRSEGSFSTLKSNMLVMSEEVFGVDAANGDGVNFPFYVAAHEMTHHWFGNATMPKDAKGALLLTESITEYIMLQILRAQFGREKARAFLEIQHRRYFAGRADEVVQEIPLYLVEPGREYLSYGKGSLALHAVSHTWGRQQFQQFLVQFFNKYQQPNGYPTSVEFLAMLREQVPDSLRLFVEELFFRSIIYDNEIVSCTLDRSDTAAWTAKIKYRINAYENQTRIDKAYRHNFELGIYDRPGDLMELVKVPAAGQSREIYVELPSQPYQLVLDPHLLTLDIDRDNNRLAVHQMVYADEAMLQEVR